MTQLIKSFIPKLSSTPRTIYQDKHVLVLYKPAKMHSVSIASNPLNSLSNWIGEKYQECNSIIGKTAGGNGLVHRLDGGTAGLLVAARSQEAYDGLLNGPPIVKHYVAFSHIRNIPEIFRDKAKNPWPQTVDLSPPNFHERITHVPLDPFSEEEPYGYQFYLCSQFEPFGPKGRWARPKSLQLRAKPAPHPDDKSYYSTFVTILRRVADDIVLFKVDLDRGYRHQIRSHLSHIGCPIVGDPLYPISENYEHGMKVVDPEDLTEPFGLFSNAVEFVHPISGMQKTVILPEFE